MPRTLVDILAETAQRTPDKVFLRHKETCLTFSETWHAVQEAAGWLASHGHPAGARVSIYLPKQPESVITFFAAQLAGYVAVPVNPVLKRRQLEHILRDSGSACLITNAARLEQLQDLQSALVELRQVWAVDDGVTCKVEVDLERRHATLESDVAAILYTSGSTGQPKGVVLSHANLLCGAQSVASYLGQDSNDRILSVLPLSFDAGFSQVSTALCSGCEVVLIDYILPTEVPKAIVRYGITALTGVPPFWMQMTSLNWEKYDTSTVRYFANTGGKMPVATLQRLRALFPQAKPFLMYGLTEAFRSTYLSPELADQFPESIGSAIPMARVGVFTPEGRECDDHEVGELVHDGPLVSLGYWNNPEETARRFKPSPFVQPEVVLPGLAVWSGDQAYRDEHGNLFFVARADEMIKTSGYRVSPAELEEFVYATGLVPEVVALGVPHPQLGAAIVLVVSGDASVENELVKSMKQELPTYMVPASIVWVAEIPRTPNGKMDRKLLATTCAEALPAEAAE